LVVIANNLQTQNQIPQNPARVQLQNPRNNRPCETLHASEFLAVAVFKTHPDAAVLAITKR
jgi:hypothetical protein